MKVTHFSICAMMAERNMDIRMGLLENVTKLERVKGGTKVTIGISGDAMAIAKGDFVGGLLLCNAKQYKAIHKELEAKAAPQDDFLIQDLSMLVRRLVRKHPNQKMAEQARDFLKRKGLEGNICRTMQDNIGNGELPEADQKHDH